MQLGNTDRTLQIGAWCHQHHDEPISLTAFHLTLDVLPGKMEEVLKLKMSLLVAGALYWQKPLIQFSLLLGPVDGRHDLILHPTDPIALHGRDICQAAMVLDGRSHGIKPDDVLVSVITDVETDRDIYGGERLAS